VEAFLMQFSGQALKVEVDRFAKFLYMPARDLREQLAEMGNEEIEIRTFKQGFRKDEYYEVNDDKGA